MLFASYFYSYAIDTITEKTSKYDKILIDLYFKNSKALRYIGNIEESYKYLNMSLICTLNNFSLNSLEMIECMINFQQFSMFIGEYKEADIYNKIIGNILKRIKNKKNILSNKYIILYLSYVNNIIDLKKERDYSYLKNIVNLEKEVNELLNKLSIKESNDKLPILNKTDNIEKIYYLYYRILIELNNTKKEEIYNTLDMRISELDISNNDKLKIYEKIYKDLISMYIYKNYDEKIDLLTDKYIDIIYHSYGKNNMYTAFLLNQLIKVFINNTYTLNKYTNNIIDLQNEILNLFYNYFKTESIKMEELNYLYADIFYNVAVISFKTDNCDIGINSLDTANFLYDKYLGIKSENLKKGLILFKHNYKKKI